MPNEIKTLENGKISAKLETGEVFEGDALEVTTKLAEAQVNTKRWGQGFRDELDTLKKTPPSVTTPPPDPNEAQLRSYLLNEFGKGLGYESGEQLKADLGKLKGSTEEMSKNMALQSFFTMHPEFPGTESANAEIGKIFDAHGWKDVTAENLHLAHLEATYLHTKDPNRGYEPLTEAQVSETWAANMAKSNRTPPPMLRSGSPDANPNQQDPWNMPINDLRNMAIRQQLEQK